MPSIIGTGALVRRLYSTFAGGLPGMGLLTMRLVLGTVLVATAARDLSMQTSLATTVLGAALASCGVLLAAGLWTPVVGVIAVGIAMSQVLALHEQPVVALLAATMAGALAMLGPGRWSVDARLFGWKRIEPSPRAERTG